MSPRKKQIHLGAHFPGVNNTTVWSDPRAGSQTDFASFVHLARTFRGGTSADAPLALSGQPLRPRSVEASAGTASPPVA